MSIIKKIIDYYKIDNSRLFTTPSHSLGSFIVPEAKEILGSKYFKADFSEIEGFDNLRDPKNTIKNLLGILAGIYDTKATFILTNGSTSGILAAMFSLLQDGDKVLIARNCHISVYNGLVLTGACPVWFTPKYDSQWGIYKGVETEDIEKYFLQNEDIKALVITSPTYEGLFSNIQDISKICSKYKVKLVVDEAHGALLNFGKFKYKPAIQLGADIAIQSLHKTAGAINPAALLHISKTSDISPECLQNALNLINTTSPSYPLIADVEATVKYLNSKNGKSHINGLLKEINDFTNSLPDSIRVYSGNNDPTKILLQFNDHNAMEIAEILNTKYRIEEEYSTEKALLFITGIGTDKNKLNHLLTALKQILKTISNKKDSWLSACYLPKTLIETKYLPRNAYKMPKTTIKKSESEGKICGECIIKYPPGIPLLLPGEIIRKEHIQYIENDYIQII